MYASASRHAGTAHRVQVLDRHHLALAAHIAPRCHQMRNLVLSAFPPHLKLMDPFAPRLRFDAVPEMKQARFAQVLLGPFGV